MHERCVEQFRIGRVLMAGDAAHVCNPLGGLGLTSGLLDAIILGDALCAVIAGRAGEELLDRYAQERRRVFTEVTGPTAAENKRRLSETNPEKKRADNERFRMTPRGSRLPAPDADLHLSAERQPDRRAAAAIAAQRNSYDS